MTTELKIFAEKAKTNHYLQQVLFTQKKSTQSVTFAFINLLHYQLYYMDVNYYRT